MMTAAEIVRVLGGSKRVMEITLLSKGRISQWVKENHIPRSWLLAFHLLDERVPAPPGLTGEGRALNAPSQPHSQTPHESNTSRETFNHE